MEKFNEILTQINDVAWGVPMLCLIMGTGILLTVRMGGLQFRKLGLALRLMVKNEEEGEGEVSSFGALCTALAATIGTGNIVGVARSHGGRRSRRTVLDVRRGVPRHGDEIRRGTSGR